MKVTILVIILFLMGGAKLGWCISKKGSDVALLPLPTESKVVLEVIPRNIVIAHRGTTYWAPEETEAAMRWARNTGADYLEFDLQRTKDGVLIALHDVNLRRTTNVAEVFPERADSSVAAFTWKELRQLDAGAWFNQAYPERARPAFQGLDILTLEDVVRIAEGNRIVRDAQGKRVCITDRAGKERTLYEPDPADNGNRPGIYPETKEPHLFPGIEQDLRKELERLGWYHPDPFFMRPVLCKPGKVSVANTPARVILQTFSDESLAKLKEAFPRRIPTCFLLWRGEEPSDLKSTRPAAYAAKINYAIEQGATIIGPSIAGAPNNYEDLLEPWQGIMIYRAGLLIHPYTFDTEEQMSIYTGLKEGKQELGRTDGMFTNQSDASIRFYQKMPSAYLQSNASLGIKDNVQLGKEVKPAEQILKELGYR